MPLLACLVTGRFGGFSNNFQTDPGGSINLPDLAANLQARGSGVSTANFAGFSCAERFIVDADAIPDPSPINGIMAVTSAKGTAITETPQLDLNIHAAPGNVTTGDQPLGSSYADTSLIYPHPITLHQLWDATIGVGCAVNANVNVEFLALVVDYGAPSDGWVTVYTAGAYPVECGQPPASRFKHFKMFDTALGLEQEVTREWMLRYGKPPAGYQLWTYYRAASYGFTPGHLSPVYAFSLDPWPPPN